MLPFFTPPGERNPAGVQSVRRHGGRAHHVDKPFYCELRGQLRPTVRREIQYYGAYDGYGGAISRFAQSDDDPL
jgi:hypothetical protein